jgi:hypothetical protein
MDRQSRTEALTAFKPVRVLQVPEQRKREASPVTFPEPS